jgi:hypothetical protein
MGQPVLSSRYFLVEETSINDTYPKSLGHLLAAIVIFIVASAFSGDGESSSAAYAVENRHMDRDVSGHQRRRR